MNRLTSAGADDYTWDDNGNLVEREEGADTWAYFYDLEDRLTSVRKNGALMNRFWYDADGRRVNLWDSQDGYLTQVYSGLYIVYEASQSGVTKHYYANGLHVAENRSGTLEFYHQDHLGSTRLKTDANGDAVFTRNYEPFGPDYDGTGSEEFKYTSKHEDPSGLYYFGARYYDPEVGRFITEDPVTGNIEDPQALNQYVYCRNNPHKYTDPDGGDFMAISSPLLAAGPIGWALLTGIIIIEAYVIVTNLGVFNPPVTTTPSEISTPKTGYIAIDPLEQLETIGKPTYAHWDPINLDRHYRKHVMERNEWGKKISKDEYAWRGINLADSEIEYEIEGYRRITGEEVRYNRNTNEFTVKSADDNIITFFKPDRGDIYYWIDKLSWESVAKAVYSPDI